VRVLLEEFVGCARNEARPDVIGIRAEHTAAQRKIRIKVFGLKKADEEANFFCMLSGLGGYGRLIIILTVASGEGADPGATWVSV
jgi:hypothetical protein